MKNITLLKNKAFKTSLLLFVFLLSLVVLYKFHAPKKEIHVTCGQIINDFSADADGALQKYSHAEIYVTGIPVYIWYPKCLHLFSAFSSGLYMEDKYEEYNFKKENDAISCSFSTAIDKSIIGKKVEIKGLLDVRSSVRFRDNSGYADSVTVFFDNCKIISVQESFFPTNSGFPSPSPPLP